jgi:magnesium transporter
MTGGLSMQRTRCYRDGALAAQGFAIAEVSDYLAVSGRVVWFDLCDPDAKELGAISEELGLHPLAVEDALGRHERPKLDRYASHLFVTAAALTIGAPGESPAAHEIAAFVTDNALVTVRKSAAFPIDEVSRRWDESADLARYGVGFLLHGLLDYVVDTHFAAVQELDSQIEALEDAVFADDSRDEAIHRRTYELRRALVLVRRVVLPMRELVNSLLRRDLHVIAEDIQPYFQDVYDHVLRATEWTESLRDLITTVLDTHVSLRGNRLNIVMKKVTSWAAIIAVPTAVTGFYGQNVPYPGFGHAAGLWDSTLIMLLLSGGLYLVFRRKDWL